ncbi:hypothetical protein JOB18_039009 [Solea senegalensis]|uniref:Uncharacterized protein n=1 Tax=Solea senegalensis TaxID=28829 RepID=A0AAV6R4B1_SOLSE|nr:hypothetical protein JOB18_039009 [Solea senegalensis]
MWTHPETFSGTCWCFISFTWRLTLAADTDLLDLNHQSYNNQTPPTWRGIYSLCGSTVSDGQNQD